MGQFNAIQEQFRFSVEQVIREHLAQDVDRDNAIIEASREITRAAMSPISGSITVHYFCSLNGQHRDDLRNAVERYGNGRLSQMTGDEIDTSPNEIAAMILGEYNDLTAGFTDEEFAAANLDIYEIYYGRHENGKVYDYPHAVRRITKRTQFGEHLTAAIANGENGGGA